MPQLIVVTRTGKEHHIEAESGKTVMEVLRGADIGEVQALCGGCCACGTCHIYVDQTMLDRLAPIGRDEDDLLDGCESRLPTSRLSCQLRMGPDLETLHVIVAPEG